MSSVNFVSINSTTPVQIFQGPGNIFLGGGEQFFVGGPTMTQTSGAADAPRGVLLPVGNEGIWALSASPSAIISVINLSSDQVTITNPTASSVAVSASSVTLASANNGRRGLVVRNGGTNVLFIAKGATATTSSPVSIAAGASWQMPLPIFLGQINGIWAAIGGTSAFIEETT